MKYAFSQVKPPPAESTALPVHIRPHVSAALRWWRVSQAVSPVTATMVAANSAIHPMRRQALSSVSHRATAKAGRVGNMSRHSNSQPMVNTIATTTTRAAVGRENHRPASAIEANITV